jgi:hypothetical protein
VSLEPGTGLRPWREVIRPHDGVARGEFTASEFAADFTLSTRKATSPEYGDRSSSSLHLHQMACATCVEALRRLHGGPARARW